MNRYTIDCFKSSGLRTSGHVIAQVTAKTQARAIQLAKETYPEKDVYEVRNVEPIQSKSMNIVKKG